MNATMNITSMGIVISKTKTNTMTNICYVLILRNNNKWVFPMINSDDYESFVQATCFGIEKESGIIVLPENCLGTIDEFSYYCEEEYDEKFVKSNLFVIDRCDPIIFNESEGFTNGKWVYVNDAFAYLDDEYAKDSLKKAIGILNYGI